MHIGITGPISTAQLAPLLNLPPGNPALAGQAVPTGMGGVPVNSLILELHRRGHRISVFSNSYDVPAGETVVLSGPNIDVYYGPYRARARQRLPDLYKTERTFIADTIRQVRPDVVHAHWQYEWAWGALDSGIPTLVTCHDSPLDVLLSMRDWYRAVRLLVAAKVLRRATYLTAVSTHTASRLGWFTKRPVSVIPNFEPDWVFDHYRERHLRIAPRIVMVNTNFTRMKNVEVGMLAFKAYRRRFPQATLHLYGQQFGAGEAAQQWAEVNGCGQNVVFHGPLPFAELIQAMSEHDLLLHTSLQESFGMVLVEAMAMGLPVVAGRASGGVPWVVGDGAGVLTDITSPEAVCDALTALSSNPTYYQTTSLRARQQAIARFSAERVVNQYVSAYHQALAIQTSTNQTQLDNELAF